MFFYDGLSCPHCHTAFREEDDIVACPQCGAPHHRHCWQENGGCACADAHGTDKQWSRDAQPTPEAAPEAPAQDTVRCPRCGADNSPYAELCAHCGEQLTARDWGHEQQPPTYGAPMPGFGEYAPFRTAASPLSGMDPRDTIEGESVGDLAATVGINTAYYLPRFRRMAYSGSKISWNWAAFLLAPLWLLFRKQYVAGALVIALQCAVSVIMSAVVLQYFPTAMSMTDYPSMAEEMMRLLQTSESAYLAGSLISMLTVGMFLVNIILGLFGNRLYMKRCLKVIRTTRESYPEGYVAQLGLVGGTSMGLALIGYMAKEFLPVILLQLLL